MPDLHPAPGAGDIGEHAARRSIRSFVVVMSVVGLLVVLVLVVVAWWVTHRSAAAGTQVSAGSWVIALTLLAVGIIFMAYGVWSLRLRRRPVYRRVMEYNWRLRRRVMRDLLHGDQLSVNDMPVAAAMVSLQRVQRRSLVVIFGVSPLYMLFLGLIQHGPLRWIFLGFAACSLVLLPIVVRQQRRVTRNFEGQNTPTVNAHPDETAP
jgi:hypothetical protein